MNKRQVTKEYIDGRIVCTSMQVLLSRISLSPKMRDRYQNKLFSLVGWKHLHGVVVEETSLYKSWEKLGELIGRKQDRVAELSHNHRTAIWAEEIDGNYLMITNNLRGTSFELELGSDSPAVIKAIDYLDNLLIP